MVVARVAQTCFFLRGARERRGPPAAAPSTSSPHLFGRLLKKIIKIDFKQNTIIEILKSL